MTFKTKVLVLIFGFMCGVSLAGCSEYLKGKPTLQNALEIKQTSKDCLKDISGEIQKFIKSESTDQDIDKTFACIDSTLNEFQTRVEGQKNAN